MVYYRCKVCKNEHPTDYPTPDEKAFRTTAWVDQKLTCPERGTTRYYNTQDFRWRESGEPAKETA